MTRCNSIEEVKALVGDEFVVSDLVEIMKTKFDPATETSTEKTSHGP